MELINKLKSSSIELLEVMLEETDESSIQLSQWIINHVNIQHFLLAMFDLWNAYSENKTSSEQWRNSVFRAYHVLKRIADSSGVTVDALGM